jgi:hypothetical protein
MLGMPSRTSGRAAAGGVAYRAEPDTKAMQRQKNGNSSSRSNSNTILFFFVASPFQA